MLSSAMTPAERVKPLLRGVSHEVAAFVSLLAGLVLLFACRGSMRAPVAVYWVSLVTLFSVSALYHRLTWSPPARRRMRRLDHSSILLLIAGTYTPICFALNGAVGRVVLAVIWTSAALGILRTLLWIGAPKGVVAAIYLAVGWAGVWSLPEVWREGGTAVFALLLGGGLLYSVGAVIYAFRRPDPWPAVFGYHEIFHALVIAAAACHFVAVARLVT